MKLLDPARGRTVFQVNDQIWFHLENGLIWFVRPGNLSGNRLTVESDHTSLIVEKQLISRNLTPNACLVIARCIATGRDVPFGVVPIHPSDLSVSEPYKYLVFRLEAW